MNIKFMLVFKPFDKTVFPWYSPKPGDKMWTCTFITPRGKYVKVGILTDDLLNEPDRKRVLDMLCDATELEYANASEKRG
jgi:hypothetical protein